MAPRFTNGMPQFSLRSVAIVEGSPVFLRLFWREWWDRLLAAWTYIHGSQFITPDLNGAGIEIERVHLSIQYQ